MQQNYGYFPTNTQPPYAAVPPVSRQPQQINLKGRPVSSIEEARAQTIDFDGSVFYFPDLASRRIYTKQINIDGTASLNMYELKEIPEANPSANEFVTREEFEKNMDAIRQMLNGAVLAQPVSNPTSPISEQRPAVNSF